MIDGNYSPINTEEFSALRTACERVHTGTMLPSRSRISHYEQRTGYPLAYHHAREHTVLFKHGWTKRQSLQQDQTACRRVMCKRVATLAGPGTATCSPKCRSVFRCLRSAGVFAECIGSSSSAPPDGLQPYSTMDSSGDRHGKFDGPNRLFSCMSFETERHPGSCQMIGFGNVQGKIQKSTIILAFRPSQEEVGR